jgi:hypothetical protein
MSTGYMRWGHWAAVSTIAVETPLPLTLPEAEASARRDYCEVTGKSNANRVDRVATEAAAAQTLPEVVR